MFSRLLCSVAFPSTYATFIPCFCHNIIILLAAVLFPLLIICSQLQSLLISPFNLPQGVSWTTVHYMLGEVQYGGRVTDDFDKRLLNTFARVWFSEEMFRDSFKFYQGYTIPRGTLIADFRAHIDEMPLSDTPEVTWVYLLIHSLAYSLVHSFTRSLI